MCPQVLKGLHGGVREVALKMLLDVEDPEKELARFTQVAHSKCYPCIVTSTTTTINARCESAFSSLCIFWRFKTSSPTHSKVLSGAPSVVVQELDLLRSLSFDKNIVQFYGATIIEGCPVLVLECMEV